jgi:hypothetical protein
MRQQSFNMKYCTWQQVHAFIVAHQGVIVEACADKIIIEYAERK